MSKQSQPMSVLVSQGTNEWYTPPHIAELARATMGGIDLDPARNAVAQRWIMNDGASQPVGRRRFRKRG